MSSVSSSYGSSPYCAGNAPAQSSQNVGQAQTPSQPNVPHGIGQAQPNLPFSNQNNIGSQSLQPPATGSTSLGASQQLSQNEGQTLSIPQGVPGQVQNQLDSQAANIGPASQSPPILPRGSVSSQPLSQQISQTGGPIVSPPSTQGLTPQNGLKAGKQVSIGDIQKVQNYIEKCLQLYLSQKEVSLVPFKTSLASFCEDISLQSYLLASSEWILTSD